MTQFNFFDRLWITMAGQDPNQVACCTADEIIRIKIRGIALLVPMIMAFLGAFMLAKTGSASFLAACVAGLAWMSLVFINDRSIMATAEPGKFSFVVLLRVLLAILTSVVVGEALLIWFFRDTISEQQQTELAARIDSIDARHYQLVEELKTEWRVINAEVEAKERDFITETDGTGGSKRRGIDKYALIKKVVLDKERLSFSADSARIISSINTLELARERKRKSVEQAQATGIAGSLSALNRIDEWYVRWGIWVLRLLLLLIDLMPVFVKYSSSKSWDIYPHLVHAESAAIRGKTTLNMEMEKEMQKEKLVFVSAEAKLKAEYEHKIKEMEYYSTFIRQATSMWEKEIKFQSEMAAEHDVNSEEVKALLDHWNSMYREKMKPAA